MRPGSWRIVIGKDRWEDNVRHIEAVAELKDVCWLRRGGGLPGPSVELRTKNGDGGAPQWE